MSYSIYLLKKSLFSIIMVEHSAIPLEPSYECNKYKFNIITTYCNQPCEYKFDWVGAPGWLSGLNV